MVASTEAGGGSGGFALDLIERVVGDEAVGADFEGPDRARDAESGIFDCVDPPVVMTGSEGGEVILVGCDDSFIGGVSGGGVAD